MKRITNKMVYDALNDSIKKRWIPIRDGGSLEWDDIPDCQLCDVFDTEGYVDPENCAGCPLTLIGQGCRKHKSAWDKFSIAHDYHAASLVRKLAAQNMINQLQKCLDKFFPAGLEKK